MFTVAIVGGCIVVGLAMAADSSATVQVVAVIITIRGITWLTKKIVQTLNRDASDILNFAGWCISGIPIIRLLGLARNGVQPVSMSIASITESINGFAEFLEKMTFWN